MKKIFLILALFLSFSAIAQEWQFEGTKYPNATNQGDTVSLETKIPLLDEDNLQNYYADLGDILALNGGTTTPDWPTGSINDFVGVPSGIYNITGNEDNIPPSGDGPNIGYIIYEKGDLGGIATQKVITISNYPYNSYEVSRKVRPGSTAASAWEYTPTSYFSDGVILRVPYAVPGSSSANFKSYNIDSLASRLWVRNYVDENSGGSIPSLQQITGVGNSTTDNMESNAILVNDGSAESPSISFQQDTDMGIFKYTDPEVAWRKGFSVATEGVERVRIGNINNTLQTYASIGVGVLNDNPSIAASIDMVPSSYTAAVDSIGTIYFIDNGRFVFKSPDTEWRVTLDQNEMTQHRSLTIPNKSGTLALLDDIAPEWGNITGNIEDQTDLQAKFDALPIPGVMEITEGGNTGYVTLFRQKYPNLFGDIGNRAIDFSASIGSSDTKGATGTNSAAIGGLNITASGTYSVVIGGNSSEASGLRSSVISANNSQSSASESVVIGGYGNISSGDYSLTSGRENYGRSFAEVSIGVKGTDYTPYSTTNVSGLDRVFNVGNATSSTSTTRSDAFTILKNGQTGIGIDNFEANTTGELLQVNGLVKSDVTTSQIDGGSAKTVVTKEWVLANSGEGDLQSVTDNGNTTDNNIVVNPPQSDHTITLGSSGGVMTSGLNWDTGGIFGKTNSGEIALYGQTSLGTASLLALKIKRRQNDSQVGLSVHGNMEIEVAGSGVYLTSPNNTKYLLTVDNAGNLTTTPAP